jgi:hypothetical protein
MSPSWCSAHKQLGCFQHSRQTRSYAFTVHEDIASCSPVVLKHLHMLVCCVPCTYVQSMGVPCYGPTVASGSPFCKQTLAAMFCLTRISSSAVHVNRFHHYDLRLDNVMEHTPDPEQDAADPISKQMLGDASGRCVDASCREAGVWLTCCCVGRSRSWRRVVLPRSRRV